MNAGAQTHKRIDVPSSEFVAGPLELGRTLCAHHMTTEFSRMSFCVLPPEMGRQISTHTHTHTRTEGVRRRIIVHKRIAQVVLSPVDRVSDRAQKNDVLVSCVCVCACVSVFFLSRSHSVISSIAMICILCIFRRMVMMSLTMSLCVHAVRSIASGESRAHLDDFIDCKTQPQTLRHRFH